VWDYRLYATSALEKMHTDTTVRKCLELLPQDQDLDIRTKLADALLGQFADAGIEPVRAMVQRRAYDPMNSDLMRTLVAVSTALGVTFPEYRIWKREAEEKLAKQERRRKEMRGSSRPWRSRPCRRSLLLQRSGTTFWNGSLPVSPHRAAGGPERPVPLREWQEVQEVLHEPGQRLRLAVLFVNGTNDFAYPLDSYRKTYRLVKDRQLGVKVNLPHSHPAGWAPIEIGLVVDQYLRGGTPLARIESATRTGKKVEVKFRSAEPVTGAALHFTSDTGPWPKRQWQTQPARIDGDRILADLPAARPLVYFVTVTDRGQATVSTEHEVPGE
jgi:hypothetical protein